MIDPLPPGRQEFLAVMGLADEFTAEMARFVTENPETDAIIQDLTCQNAFVTRLPDSQRYRFHHMMKECALRKFRTLPEQSQICYWNRFGSWYGAQGQYLHALGAYGRSGNSDAALTIIEKDAGNLLSALHPEGAARAPERLPGGGFDAPSDGDSGPHAPAFYLAADSEDAAAQGASGAGNCGKPRYAGGRTREFTWRVRPHHELSHV